MSNENCIRGSSRITYRQLSWRVSLLPWQLLTDHVALVKGTVVFLRVPKLPELPETWGLSHSAENNYPTSLVHINLFYSGLKWRAWLTIRTDNLKSIHFLVSNYTLIKIVRVT